MKPERHADDGALPLSGDLRVDQVCLRFEAAWKAGPTPRIEDYLGRAAGAELASLLRELILLDIAYRRMRGEAPRAQEYLPRFPELNRDWLEDALRVESPSGPGDETADPNATYSNPNGQRDSGRLTGADAPPALPSVPGYEVLRVLKRGGMGVVYEARQLGFNRIVALKMILSGSHAGPEDLARFRIEQEAVARLQHPNIVQVFEVSECEGKPFFSMEFCPGGGLDRKLNGTPLPPAEAARLVETLARAVQAAHEKGVVHRDLKPANVLLTADGTPKVADFGLAKRLDAQGPSLTDAVMGTPSYMAPEQASRTHEDGKPKEIGPAADTYAVGAILYECLTGRPPFRAATVLDTLLQVVSDDPVPPRQLQSKTPRDLDIICLKCLEKEPARRYATAAALADDLGRWQRGEPIWARPPSLGYVLGKWAWRRRTPLSVAAGMLLLLVAVVAAAFVLLLGAWGTAQKNFETADQKGKDLEKSQGELQGALHQTKDALNAKQDALNAKQDALDAQKRQLSVSARIAAGRSDAEYRAGNLRDSLNWMLQAYELAPREDSLRPSYARQIGGRGRGLSDLALWHDGEVLAASFSPDGRTVVTASADKTARLWDAASGKELQRLTHEDAVTAASFSPDGHTVVTACYDKTARLWDVQSGKLLQRLPHDDFVDAVSFSPDGRTVVTACQDKTARLWEVASGKELQRLTHEDVVEAASFSPDGRTVLTAGWWDKTARLWDAASGKELQRFTHDGPVSAASFSPDGRTVLTASNLGSTTRLWDAASGKPLQRLEHDGYVRAASFSPDGRTVVTASEDKTARLWDAASGKELLRLPHEDYVNAASFSPDGRTIVTASVDKTARLWDAATGEELQRLKNEGPVWRASFSPDGRTVVTASADKTAHLWDAASGTELQPLKHDAPVLAASFSLDGRTVVTACQDKTARLWDAAYGKELQRLTHELVMVKAASFSPDGRTVLTASSNLFGVKGGEVRLWDAASGKELHRLTHEGFVFAVSFSPDGRTIVTASDIFAQLWDAASGKELQRLTHERSVTAASFSPDGRTVLTASRDKTARLWDAASGKELQRLTHDGEVWAASFSPDGRTVLTASDDKTARLWDAASGKELLRLPHEDKVRAASFSPDGRTVVTADDESTARMWDVGFLSVPDGIDPDRLRAWVLVRTGQDFTAEGTLRPLTKKEYELQRQTLEAKGGDWQPPPDPRKWHLAQAADAEAHGPWFAARFHLNWLLAADPKNAELLRRLATMEVRLRIEGR